MSFDLVSDRVFVVEADIFDRIPLPGSEVDSDGDDESNQGHAQIVNVVVCALSLMGTNWPNCIREAWRILRPKSVLDLIPECRNTPSLTPLDQWRIEDCRSGQSFHGHSTVSVVRGIFRV
jgi:hypothetical protein